MLSISLAESDSISRRDCETTSLVGVASVVFRCVLKLVLEWLDALDGLRLEAGGAFFMLGDSRGNFFDE